VVVVTGDEEPPAPAGQAASPAASAANPA
jgi:hypothetical protein